MKLELLIGDTKRQETQAQKHVYTLAESDCVAYIGPSASNPAKMVSILTSMPPKDRAVISYSATSTELSEPRFANFLRTPRADDVPAKMMATTMVSMIKGPLVVGLAWAVSEGTFESSGYTY